MRFRTPRILVLAGALGLATPDSSAPRVQAQEAVCPNCGSAHGWGHSWRRPVFPRTYSYLYGPASFNRPCHFRYVGPDGKTYWTSAVRGLPIGTPWLGR